MPNGDGSDLVAIVVGEVAKQVPVKAALEPAATEIGGLGSDLMKCVRLALAPVQYLAVQQDRFRRFIEDSAQRVPEDRRVAPAPQILGPILEGIRYEPEHSLSDEAFSVLLSRAFDRERLGQAHPAFPGIIRALADDEIIVLRTLQRGPIEIVDGYMRSSEDTWDADASSFAAGFPDVLHPSQFRAFLKHIEAHGLLQPLVSSQGQWTQNGSDTAVYPLILELRLSDFGELFASACLMSSEAT